MLIIMLIIKLVNVNGLEIKSTNPALPTQDYSLCDVHFQSEMIKP